MTKYILFLFSLLILAVGAFAQAPEDSVDGASVAVEEIYLAKDNGFGEAGDEAFEFFTDDIPIYCVVRLNSTASATVKMDFIAVDVKGVKPETRVVSVSFTTNGLQDRVNFKGRPHGKWAAGKYRVDVFLNGIQSGNKELEIKAASSKAPVNEVIQHRPAKKNQRAKRKN